MRETFAGMRGVSAALEERIQKVRTAVRNVMVEGLRSRIVKFCRLPDNDRTGTDDKYFFDVWILRHYLSSSNIT